MATTDREHMLLTRAAWRGLQGRDRLLEHIERTGRTIAGDPIWTATEIDTLRSLYPDHTAISAALPRRTRIAVAAKARAIGLVPPRRIWSHADAVRLRNPYVAGIPVATLTQLFAGKTPKQIWSKASALGYRRPRRPPRLIGHPLIDSIRRRAFDLRITMTELDAFVGRKRYFVGVRNVDWRALQRAMSLLGGTPIVRWPEA